MKDLIEKCAARVVSLLREKHSLNVLLFPELLGERSAIAYQALGWLAREGKVRYVMKGRQCYLWLAEETESPRGSGKGKGAGDALI
jgi:hypothetical protein